MCWRDGKPPAPLPALPKGTSVAHITIGGQQWCVATGSGQVLCRGGGEDGELGDGRRQSSFGTWVRAANVTGAVEVAAGKRHTCARSGAGTVWCWGAPPTKVAALDATSFSLVPQRVRGL
jgi:alpha-tubulin suppressor-like RCC1 family protein